MHFANQQRRSRVEEVFSFSLYLRVSFRDLLSPTEVIQLDASLLFKIQKLQSVFHSNFAVFLYKWREFGKVQCF